MLQKRIETLEKQAPPTGGITEIEIWGATDDGGYDADADDVEEPIERWNLKTHVTEYWNPDTESWQAEEYARPDAA